MADVQFDRRPYKVEYYKDGKKHTINRRPPPKLHKMQAEDEVVIQRKKNDDWDKGSKVEIKNITNRQPNVLQVVGDDGKTTFLDFYDVKLSGRKGLDAVQAEELAREADPIGSNYLMWP